MGREHDWQAFPWGQSLRRAALHYKNQLCKLKSASFAEVSQQDSRFRKTTGTLRDWDSEKSNHSNQHRIDH